MKIEPNMYVRTKKIGIKQIYKIDNKKTKYKYLYKLKIQDGDGCIDCGVLADEDITKASHNIIDLIEVGDYVNGYKITLIHETYNVLYAEDERGYLIKSFGEEDIKSIVTKEQFSSIEYRLGE